MALSTCSPLLAFSKPRSNTGLVLDDNFLRHQISPSHPEKPARYQAIKQQLLESNLVNKTVNIKPIENAEQWLTLVHLNNQLCFIKMVYFILSQIQATKNLGKK